MRKLLLVTEPVSSPGPRSLDTKHNCSHLSLRKMLSKSLIIKEMPIKNKSIGSQLSKLRARKSDNTQAGENVGGIGILCWKED